MLLKASWTIGVVLVLSLLTACGSGADAGGGGKDPERTADKGIFQVPDGAWLMMYEYESDAETQDDVYLLLAYSPRTGKTVKSPLAMREHAEPEWDLEPLTISADFQWTLHSTVASNDENESGIVPLYRLGDGSVRKLDLREITGDIRLSPTQLIFDGTDPDTLRVGTESGDIWVVDVQQRTATKADTKIEHPKLQGPGDSQYYAWEFAHDGSGRIIKDRPDGDPDSPNFPEDDSVQPGLTPLSDEQEEQLPDLPDYADETVQTADGAVLAFLEESENPSFVRAYRYPADAGPSDDWKRMKPSAPLPQTQDGGIEFVRPPRR